MAALAFSKWTGVNSHLRWRDWSVFVIEDVLGFHQERLVVVRADAVGLTNLPEVHRLVLVAQKWLRDLLGRARKFGNRFGYGIEVLHRRQRDGDPGHPPNARRPDSGGGDDQLGLNVAMIGMDSIDPPVFYAESGDLHAAVEGRPLPLGSRAIASAGLVALVWMSDGT